MGADLPSDEEVLAAARSFNHTLIDDKIENAMIHCQGGDCDYFISDPRDDPDWDGNLTAECFLPPFGGF